MKAKAINVANKAINRFDASISEDGVVTIGNDIPLRSAETNLCMKEVFEFLKETKK